MALEAVVFQPDPFIYACKDFNYALGISDYAVEDKPKAEILDAMIGENVLCSSIGVWDSPPSSVARNANSSPEDGGVVSPSAAPARRKRRRTKSLKNKEEMENQRMTHIAVERNRRRQMNDYLAVLRSLMPPSYAQRGDQASIVGGAINFVKELEQLFQLLESKKSINQQNADNNPEVFSNFFTFPQYTMRSSISSPAAGEVATEQLSSVAEIEVTMVESHANIKLLSKRRPKQLLKMVAGLQSVGLTILHLNITTVDLSVLYSFSVKVEDECQLSTVNEIATAVHDMVAMIQQDTAASC